MFSNSAEHPFHGPRDIHTQSGQPGSGPADEPAGQPACLFVSRLKPGLDLGRAHQKFVESRLFLRFCP